MKLYIFVGTRPEIIRLSQTIKQCKNIFNTTLVHTGQNYDYNLNDVFFNDLDLSPPDIYLDCSKDNPGAAVGDVISKSYKLLLDNKPDAILILGDTNSCLCAYSAKRLKIPIFHIEAGNRCFDPNVPEEINRKIIDHLSEINMCYMHQAKTNLLKENCKPEYTFVIGSPIPEVMNFILPKVEKSDILERLALKPKEYFVWSTHREENIDCEKNFETLISSLDKLSTYYPNFKIVFSVHPRTRKKIQKCNSVFNQNVILSNPLGLIDYYNLQINSYCVISDSGTVTEESSILKFCSILIRSSTEHPEGIESGNIVLSNLNWNCLENSIKLAISFDNKNSILDYVDNNFSEKVCKIIFGYTSIANKFLWCKSD
jgi:UDP-N-acetylglucosamine 2-epimerase (non-hydrolysing)